MTAVGKLGARAIAIAIAKALANSPEARILRILKDLPESERMDVLAIVCSAFVQTNGSLSSEAKRNSRETVLGPLKRKPCPGCNGCGFFHESPADNELADKAIRSRVSAERKAGRIGVK